ncbi:YgjP-like metallopeptidase domain-containing protein [uncultured Ilyobacter sp.]|uniref:YgjP-like metallopeptidase domain-containing protein n=1 Tax=uncultured Ilyobacter sp. TaxID=544433 RepID=UPI0029C8AA78|nr:YgjP-like metallopeptidase domain-containing protein [uncultured Ilyobacter sp.]
MERLKYLGGYDPKLKEQVITLIENNKLGEVMLKKYPDLHEIPTDKMLYDYVIDIKNQYLKKSNPISKVSYDSKINFSNQALGLHTYVSRVQGSKLKTKNEIKISSQFKKMPLEFLRMIVVHELAHLKEKSHDKSFYKLCEYMEPNYHQFEFDMRLYLTYMDIFKKSLY